MKVECDKCGAVFDTEKTERCPICFEYYVEDDEETEPVKTEETEELEETVTDGTGVNIVSILKRVFWGMIALIILVSMAFSAVTSFLKTGYKPLIKALETVYQTGETDDYLNYLPKQYIDNKIYVFGSFESYKSDLESKFKDRVKSDAEKFGKDYKVNLKIKSTTKLSKEDIKTQIDLLPYAIDGIDKMEQVELVFEYSGTKKLKYTKNLLLGEIEDKWYILNADDQ